MPTGWTIAGFLFGVIAGTLATDLDRENTFIDWLHFWRAPLRQRWLARAIVAWALVFFVLIVLRLGYLHWSDPWTREGEFVVGTITGAVGAPWVWLHFSRRFGSNAEKNEVLRDDLIRARARAIWLAENQPSGKQDQHWETAERELIETENTAVNASEKSATQEIERYRFVSILLAGALLVPVLLPLLRDLIPRTQQVQVLGLSATFLAQRTSPSLGIPIGQAPGSDVQTGGSRLVRATAAAYRIIPNDAKPQDPRPRSTSDVGADLQGFQELSLFDRDRAFIAWFEAEYARRLGKKGKSKFLKSEGLMLDKYVELFESDPAIRRMYIGRDLEFIKSAEIFSRCLREYSQNTNNPQLFLIEVGNFFNSYIRYLNGRFLHPGIDSTPDISKIKYCNVPPTEDSKNPTGYPFYTQPPLVPTNAQSESIGVTPYPAMMAAQYLAAINSVDGGVSLLERWVKEHGNPGDDLANSNQFKWYLIRCMMMVTQLPYAYGGFIPSHELLVQWQERTTELFGQILGLDGSPKSWERLCERLEGPTLHGRLGRSIALTYALERFYFFELLTSDDLEMLSPIARQSAKLYLSEAETIRDQRGCFQDNLDYKEIPHHQGYFELYAAKLKIMASKVTGPEGREALVRDIRRQLSDARQLLGPSAKAANGDDYSLLSIKDVWERHRAQARLLENELNKE